LARSADPADNRTNEPATIMIVGSARSGTTWLARLLDHHPRLIYRHEPDAVLRSIDLPRCPPAKLFAALAPAAHQYFEELSRVRVLKTFGPRPAVHKPYRSWSSHLTRTTLATVLRIAEELPGGWRARQAKIPDLISGVRQAPLPLVKSVDSLCRLGLFARVAPRARFLHLVRHPCAVVASMLRGRRLGKLHRDFDMGLLDLEVAHERQLDANTVLAMPEIQRLALDWALANEAAIVGSQGCDNVRMARYESLCVDLAVQLQKLMIWLGLELDAGIERAASRSVEGTSEDGGYFSLVRDPYRTMNRWREDLRADQIDIILHTVRDYRAAALYDFP